MRYIVRKEMLAAAETVAKKVFHLETEQRIGVWVLVQTLAWVFFFLDIKTKPTNGWTVAGHGRRVYRCTCRQAPKRVKDFRRRGRGQERIKRAHHHVD